MAEQERGERLVETEHHPNCPGCKVERYKASQRGFPFRDLFSIWIIVLANDLILGVY
ncbi:hypothetical protein TorRG33x02_174240 [Trema orientale]|uniref:Uncharacterized protein n=1 Tax=Trema orientale TaxID=63057 RepID=A0A2P5EMS8_TREOI|nr:hypothetical protein TorRG33x02_174240 [Trema orientale]